MSEVSTYIKTVGIEPHMNNEEEQALEDVAVKRKYSRNGCTECKKRRMKCDETKPKCWPCNRLNRECVYILNRKNKKRSPKVSKGTQNINIKNTNIEQPSQFDVFNFTASDANSLFNDLNEIVNFRLEEALTPNLKTYIQESSNPFNTDFLKNTGIPSTVNNEIIIIHSLESFNLGDPHNGYLKRFYQDFCKLLCPFIPSHNENPVRDVLLQYAKRETYLMYAVLACGARSAHRDSLTTQDDQAYCSYLSSCLNILSENFAEESTGNENVEALLLTILLLTSDSASSKSLIWRTHLKGAKDLLKRTTIQSDILNFCRNWLIAYELLAGISNPFGGIFQEEPLELNGFLNNDGAYLTSLRKLNLVDIHHFNYFDGHVIELDLVMRDITNILNRMRQVRNSGWQESSLDSKVIPPVVSLDEITHLLMRIDQLEKISIIDSSGIIPQSNPNHPSQNAIEDGFDCIDTLKIDKDLSVTVSWFDISHQAHTIAAKITLLIKVLEVPRTSILVQELVTKGLRYLKFLDHIPDYRNPCMTHLHIMVDILGRYMINEEDMKLTRKFLTILDDMGLASAGHNLKKLERIWNNDPITEQEEDVLTW